MKKLYVALIGVVFIFGVSSVSAGIFNSLLGDQSPVDDENDIELNNVTLRAYAIDALDTQEYLIAFKDDPETYNNNDTISWLENLDDCVILPQRKVIFW